MSIELDILPTINETVCWRDVENRLRKLLGPSAHFLLGERPALLQVGSNLAVDQNEPLSVLCCYHFAFAVPNTLALAVVPNKENMDEYEYLEKYGRNLAPQTLRQLADYWRVAGYYYGIDSLTSRSRLEPKLFVALASAFADACNGYVAVIDDQVFDLQIGVYSSEQFSHAQPRF